MRIRKKIARRTLARYRSPYQDPFRYRSLKAAGRRAFLKVFAQVVSGSLSREDGLLPAAQEFDALVRLAGGAFDPKRWELAYLDGKAVGMVMPQPRPNDPNEGTIYYFGVVPACRGRGFGRLLHAHGLERLAREGVRRYVGGADVRNRPMLRIFKENGCVLKEVRVVDTHGWLKAQPRPTSAS